MRIGAALLGSGVSALVLAVSGHLGYVVRGFGRTSSEMIGLPQAIPNDRKLDYYFRDFYLVSMTPLIMEANFRMGEQFYTIPMLFDSLKLGKLGQLYPKGSLHTPAFYAKYLDKNKAGLEPLKDFPKRLLRFMVGNIVKSSSYYTIPKLLEEKEVPALQKKLKQAIRNNDPPQVRQALRQEIAATRLQAHHLRRILLPEQYLDDFLVKTNKVSKQQAKAIKALLGQLDEWHGLFSKVDRSQVLSTSLAKIYKQKLPAEETAKLVAEAKGKPLQQLHALFKKTAETAFGKRSAFVRKLANMSDEQLLTTLKGSATSDFFKLTNEHGFSKGLAMFRQAQGLSPQAFMETIYKEVLLPQTTRQSSLRSKAGTVLKDLVESKFVKMELDALFKRGNMWLKLPLGILGYFISYGLIGNYIDNKFIQPYQRKLVKKYGDSKAIEKAGYLSAFVGGLSLFGLMRLKPIQKLGYAGSFIAASLLGFGIYTAMTLALFFKTLGKLKSKTDTDPQQSQGKPSEKKQDAPKTTAEASTAQAIEEAPVFNTPQTPPMAPYPAYPPQTYAYPYGTPYGNPFYPNSPSHQSQHSHYGWH